MTIDEFKNCFPDFEEKRENFEKLIEANNYHPLFIGISIIEALGYKVQLGGFWLNNLNITINKD